jgi:hypothetical protein
VKETSRSTLSYFATISTTLMESMIIKTNNLHREKFLRLRETNHTSFMEKPYPKELQLMFYEGIIVRLGIYMDTLSSGTLSLENVTSLNGCQLKSHS